jgi:HEAT repeat protein
VTPSIRTVLLAALLASLHAPLHASSPARAQDPGEKPPQEPEAPQGEPAPKPMPAPDAEAPRVDAEDLAARTAEEPPEERPAVSAWRERLARDKDITFSVRSAADASAALERTSGMAQRRAAAWMTLGCAGSPADRGRLETQARSGKGLERRAAILGLGELKSDETALLASLAEETDAAAAECALLALLRSKRPAARERVEAIAGDAAHARSASAAALLAFDRDPASLTVPRAARLWIDLHWEAARAFGGIKGLSFATHRIEELASSASFRSQVVLRAAARLPGAAPKDHVFARLLEGSGDARLIAAVEASPRALSRLVDSGLWTPRDTGEWSALLGEIERERAEGSCPELLACAAEVPGLAWSARVLLARTGRLEMSALEALDPARMDVGQRALAAQVLGSIDDPAALEALRPLSADADPGVRGAALVARLRRSDKSAVLPIERILEDRAKPEHASVLENLCRNAHEPAIAIPLEKYLRRGAVGPEVATVASALCLQNRPYGRAIVRSLLALDVPPVGPRRLLLVRALCRRPTAQDTEILTQLFPQPGEEELNLELAAGLTLLDDPAVDPILRSALWGSGFDEGVLAGMLIVEKGGYAGLIEEIVRPPAEARPEDLRRAGFALGEWGGIEALNLLQRKTGSAGSPAVQGALLGVLAARTQ